MNKLLATIVAALFMFGSTAAMADHHVAPQLKYISAQEILNTIACKDKKPGEQVKDQTDSKMITCPEPKKAEGDLSS